MSIVEDKNVDHLPIDNANLVIDKECSDSILLSKSKDDISNVCDTKSIEKKLCDDSNVDVQDKYNKKPRMPLTDVTIKNDFKYNVPNTFRESVLWPKESCSAKKKSLKENTTPMPTIVTSTQWKNF